MKLTGNDLALAQEAIGLALNYWRKHSPLRGTGYVRDRIAQLVDLNDRLGAIGDYAYPYSCTDGMPRNVGNERIMRLDGAVVRKTRRSARRAEAAA